MYRPCLLFLLLLIPLLPALALAQQPPTPTPPRRGLPVDTRQFGLLAVGMTPESVQYRLGPPAEIVPLAPLIVTRGHSRPSLRRGERRHESVSVAVPREVWRYPGTAGIPPTELVFAGGRLAAWQRLR